MHPVKAPLKRWLKQQQQVIPNCTAALLVQRTDDGKTTFVAQYPEPAANSTSLDTAITLAAEEVLQKQRLHLVAQDDRHMLMAQPVSHQGKLWGAVILQLEIGNKKDVPASLKRLQEGMVWLQFLLIQQETPALAPATPEFHASAHTEQLLQLAIKLLGENSLQEMTISLVNFLASQLQSNRVCLGLQAKTGIELTAVSFSANFDKRTSAMQLLSDAMDEAADQRINIHLDVHSTDTNSTADSTTDPTRDLSKASTVIQRCHENLLKHQQVAAVDSFLLRKGTQIIGVVTLEHRTNELSAEQTQFLQGALRVAQELIALKQASQGSIREHLRQRTRSQLTRWFGDNKLTRKLIGAAAVLLLCTLFFPANYWVASEASLQSTYKYLVVAPQEGYLSSIALGPGAKVKKGDALAQLNDEELRLERRKLFSQMQQSQQEYDNALANGNRAQAAIANEKVEQATSQLELIEQQQARTQLVAPSDGIITSDDISQTLGAPVKQGQVLFEISASQGYVVHLWVDERDIRYLKPDQPGKIKLTSIPNEHFDITLKNISPISEIREGKNYFRVEAKLNRESDVLRPGMTGSGKVLVGSQFLGWIWFHDLWYWLRLTLWF